MNSKRFFNVDLVFFGVPGAGKGTQVAKLWGKYGKDEEWYRVQTGNIFRDLSKKETPLARKVKEIIDSGNLVPDDVVNEVIIDAIEDPNVNGKNWIFDGYPRNLEQASQFLKYYKERHPAGNLIVLSLVLSFDEAIRRMRSRLTCDNCNAIASEKFDLNEGEECKHCNSGTLYKRVDQLEEAGLKRRIDIFEETTLPIYEFFKENGLHVEMIDGSRAIKEIHDDIVEILEKYKVE